ncbi:ABC-F family ATP-binding cassette domain-containing protein [uncultured Clostridium sp.]|uniref:ABC-F family ATP-binding cassette domain-containing protein n=1 Tax=uncultured Clostridium sp. TaxID=59620 RepID=UPI0025E8FBBC|nr:ABC-F family ATP-binding cassette domain-containing protein [uncultured Clostridium sp.]
MSILDIRDMTQGFGDKVIFNNVSFKLEKGEHIGLVGANGQGKTTFMKLITKSILPDKGTIEWSSKVKIGYMDQNVALKDDETVREYLRKAFKELFDMEKKLEDLYIDMASMEGKELENALKKVGRMQDLLEEEDFYSIESKIEGIANGLGFSELLEKHTSNLSGGQRSKIILGKLLLEKPDILLLDEPTNHLDEENIEWLKGYLNDYDNSFILISHDNSFINSVSNVIYHLENKTLTRYSGNYEKFLKLYEERKVQLGIEYARQQKEIKKLEDYIRKNMARASTTAMAKSREKKLNKIERIEILPKNPKPHFNFKESRASGSLIFETKNLVIGYDKPLCKPLNLSMKRGEKIAIIGANGIGKTTLLKSLMGILSPLGGNVKLGMYQYLGYFEQEVREDINEKLVINELWDEFPRCNQTEIRTKLARCGLTRKHIDSPMRCLSGGEQAKVRLCKLINKESNILVLDEPTNHLDKDAKDELKRALKEYKGSILLVSHEPDFYRDVVTDIWNCEEWTLKVI